MMGKQSLFIAAKEDFRDLFCFLKTRGGVPLTVYGEEIHPEDPDFSIPSIAFVHFPAQSKVTMALHRSGRSVLSIETRNQCIEVAEHGAGILDYTLPVSRIYMHTTAYPDTPAANWLIKEYQALARYIQNNAVRKDKSSNFSIHIMPIASKIITRKCRNDVNQRSMTLHMISIDSESIMKNLQEKH